MTRKKIKINGTITSDSNASIYRWFGIQAVSPSLVADALEEAAGAPVDVLINSGGGSVFAGSEIYTMLKEYPGEVIGKITGLAASAASFLAMGVDKLLISPTGQIMIHNSSTYSEGDRHTHTGQAGMLLSTDEAITNAYALKTGKSKEELLALMDSETWMNAQKAVELGFADEIMFAEETPAISNSLSSFVELPQEVIDKVRSELLKNGSHFGIPGFQEPINSVELKSEKGDDRPMNLEELKAQHPALYNEVLNLGVSQERSRITLLNALAGAPGAADIVAKAIENGATAGEAAMEIVKASQERLTTEAKNRAADSKDSGAEEVPADEAPNDKKDPEASTQQEADALVAEIKALRGAK